MDTGSCEIPNSQVQKPPTANVIEEFEAAPETIASAIKGLTTKQLQYHITDTEWNIHQVIVHLTDTEFFFSERIRKIIAEEKPLLQSFNQEVWANHLYYDKQDYHIALDLLKIQRKSTAGLLRLLPFDTWKRIGIHAEKEKTLYDIFTTAFRHIPTHLQQILDIKNNPTFPPTT